MIIVSIVASTSAALDAAKNRDDVSGRVMPKATIVNKGGRSRKYLNSASPMVMLYKMSGRLAADSVGIEKAAIRRDGRDISLVTCGASLWKTLEAALVVDVGRRSGSLAAEVGMRIIEQAFWISTASRTSRSLGHYAERSQHCLLKASSR
jgi:hypothetical protein